MAARSSSPWLTATASPRSRGRTCCAAAPAAGCAPRSMAVGDGALGFWNGLREVFPQAREGRCWFHKTANVLAGAAEVSASRGEEGPGGDWAPRTSRTPSPRWRPSGAAYGAKLPKATAKITDDVEELLAFSGYPAEHWVHLRTTNPIESAFRDGQAPDEGHQGSRLAGRRAGHGVQAHRVSARPLARRQRPSPRRPGPCRSDLHQRKTHPTTRRETPSRKPHKRS